MRFRVADVAPLAILAAAIVAASLSPDYTAAGPSGAVAATVSADQTVYAAEEGGSVRVKVTVATPSGGPLTAPVTVGYATAAGTATAGVDYRPVNGTLVFPAGTHSGITETFVVRANRDHLVEAPETAPVTLASATIGVRVSPAQPTIVILSAPGPDRRAGLPG